MEKKIYFQKGQAALIALLVLIIATTVGLSLIARSTTDLSITRNVEESSRAFSAAEAGVERALRSGADVSSPSDNTLHTSYNAKVKTIAAVANAPYTLPNKTLPGNTETIWLTTHTGNAIDVASPVYKNPSVDVCWSGGSPSPALVATILYKSGSDYRVAKAAYDPEAIGNPGTGRANDPATGNRFSAPVAISDGSCGGASYKATITFASFDPVINPASDVLIALRLRPVYNSTQLTVVPTADLPNQGKQIESIGTTDSGVNRKIAVYQQYKSPATIFDAAIYSEGSFTR